MAQHIDLHLLLHGITRQRMTTSITSLNIRPPPPPVTRVDDLTLTLRAATAEDMMPTYIATLILELARQGR